MYDIDNLATIVFRFVKEAYFFNGYGKNKNTITVKHKDGLTFKISTSPKMIVVGDFLFNVTDGTRNYSAYYGIPYHSCPEDIAFRLYHIFNKLDDRGWFQDRAKEGQEYAKRW